MAKSGLVLAATSSASGKTLITLGVLGALRGCGVDVVAAKSGPDYIDPAFHTAASGKPTVNLDPFAMSDDLINHLAHQAAGDVLVIEGAMGIFDGAEASTAKLAEKLRLPVILIIDARGQGETSAVIAKGIDQRLKAQGAVGLSGVILNRIRSPRHEALITVAMQREKLAVLGAIPDLSYISMPSRHLGLVQASDLAAQDALAPLLDAASMLAENYLDREGILACARPLADSQCIIEAMPAPAQRIAIAQDRCFGFCYQHLIDGWRRQGAEVISFSPLADEAPDIDAGLIYLPGGYPELHLDTLSAAKLFMTALHEAAARGVPIYGECGGYMVLGQSVIDEKGHKAPMAGLLSCITSFAEKKLHLGYRHLRLIGAVPLPTELKGHEFHYTTAIAEHGAPLFEASDKEGNLLGHMGLIEGSVSGSYAHIIAAAHGTSART